MSSRSALRSAGSIPALIPMLVLVAGSAGAADRAVAPSELDPGLEVGAEAAPVAEPIVLAQDGGTTPRELEPRYPAPDPGKPGPYNEQEREVWNGDYVFGMSRSLARSTIVPAAKAPLFLFTVPLDIAFLPFALIGGFFG